MTSPSPIRGCCGRRAGAWMRTRKSRAGVGPPPSHVTLPDPSPSPLAWWGQWGSLSATFIMASVAKYPPLLQTPWSSTFYALGLGGPFSWPHSTAGCPPLTDGETRGQRGTSSSRVTELPKQTQVTSSGPGRCVTRVRGGGCGSCDTPGLTPRRHPQCLSPGRRASTTLFCEKVCIPNVLK